MAQRKIRIGNEDVDATEVSFQNVREHWNEYLLDDGTILKVKLVGTQVLRLDGRYDADGNPAYIIRSTNVVVANAPDQMRKRPEDRA